MGGVWGLGFRVLMFTFKLHALGRQSELKTSEGLDILNPKLYMLNLMSPQSHPPAPFRVQGLGFRV